MNKHLSNAALRRAIAEFPTLAEFSGAIGARYQNVQAWFKNRVPAEYCPLIERAVHGRVLCEELRPDIEWSYLRNTKRRLKAYAATLTSDKESSHAQ